MGAYNALIFLDWTLPMTLTRNTPNVWSGGVGVFGILAMYATCPGFVVLLARILISLTFVALPGIKN